MKQAKVFFRENFSGILTEDENGYTFVYNTDYLQKKDAKAVSLTLPLSKKPYNSPVLFPFFDGLIPEGWLLDIADALVIPEDKEELALTLNGKKSRLNRKDFETAALNSGLEQKVIENIFAKFQKTIPKWDLLIDNSFLSNEMKENYKNLIQKRKDRILT